jgi:hypothetical protein
VLKLPIDFSSEFLAECNLPGLLLELHPNYKDLSRTVL